MILKGADPEFVKIIEKCLQWEPKMRISPGNALKSEWYIENNSQNKNRLMRRCKINMEDITKRTTILQKFIADRSKTQLLENSKHA